MSPVTFYIEGPVGKEGYEQAKAIAEEIENFIITGS